MPPLWLIFCPLSTFLLKNALNWAADKPPGSNSKPPAGFFRAQSQFKPETQYLIPYLPTNPREVASPADPTALICIPDHKPPAGFYNAQPQITPETKYLTTYSPNQPAGGCFPTPLQRVVTRLVRFCLIYRRLTSRGFLSRSITNHIRNPLPHHLLARPTRGRLHPQLIHRRLTSRGFLSRSTTNHSRNPIPHPLLVQNNPREVASPANPPAINLPRVFITLNHKSFQKSNTSSITCPKQPAGGCFPTPCCAFKPATFSPHTIIQRCHQFLPIPCPL